LLATKGDTMKIHTKYFGPGPRQNVTKDLDLPVPTVIKDQKVQDYDGNRWITKSIKLIPFNTQKAPNGVDNWVYFDLDTEEWIYGWLTRIVLEYQHKINTFPTALGKLDQTINKKGTYDRLNSFNSILTTCSGLVLNRTRATEIKFTTKQLADIEKVFDIATYVFRDIRVKNHSTGEFESSVLTTKDIGYHRTTKVPNEDIMRIYFMKNPGLTIGADGHTYDDTPLDLFIGGKNG